MQLLGFEPRSWTGFSPSAAHPVLTAVARASEVSVSTAQLWRWEHTLSCPPGPAPAEPWSPVQDRRASRQCPLFKCTVTLIFDVLKGGPVRPCASEHLKGGAGPISVFLLKSTHSLEGPDQVTQLLYRSESCLKTQTDTTVSRVQDNNITGTTCPLSATPLPS